MNPLLLFLVVTVAAFLLRLAGLTMEIPQLSTVWEQLFRFVPISIFTALIVSSLYASPDLRNLKILALVVAGAVAWRTRQMGLSILVGLAILWMFVLLDIK
jgi:branched-subunit amino acid transport protein